MYHEDQIAGLDQFSTSKVLVATLSEVPPNQSYPRYRWLLYSYYFNRAKLHESEIIVL